MKFGSVCSGIEAASLAWFTFGWRCAFVSEIDPFCCALLNHYHPTVPNYGDMLKFSEWPAAAIDVLVGGTPCQSFSVAGLRGGLADPRGNLTLGYLAVLAKYRPRWCVWENVPGVLSDDGRAFDQFCDGLTQCGYGWAWRVLDAQYFGLAQRRERVFVVGCSGGRWQRAAAVLFDGASMRGNPAPRREAGKRVARELAPCVGSSGRGFERTDETRGQDCVIPIQEIGKRQSGTPENGVGYGKPGDPMFTIQASCQHGVAHTYTSEGHDASEDGTGRGVPLVAAPIKCEPSRRNGGSNPGSGGRTHSRQIAHGMAVRRLTPREVERLFGFPDDYTLTHYRGKPAKDSPRYRALGNSFAVPVVRWIGKRINQVNELCPQS